MIEAIRVIGEYVMRDRWQFLENLCINLPATRPNIQKKEFKQHGFILNLAARGKIVCDFEAVKDNSGRTYRQGGITPKTKRKYFSQQIIPIVFLPRYSQISENWRMMMILEEKWINCWMNFSYDEMDPYCDHGTGFKRENARGGALIYQDCLPFTIQ